MNAELLDALGRAFGSKAGGTPLFTAEAEGDDYLFGRPPGSKYAGVAALWNGDQHAVDPTYAPREEWSILDAETIAHNRRKPAVPKPERPPMPGGSLFGAILAGEERMRERRQRSGASE